MSGSIRKRGEGSWQVRVSTGARDPASGRYLYAERHVRGTKRDAQRALDALSVEVARGGHRQQAKRRTVSDLLEAWMAHLEAQGRAPTTMHRYRTAIRANINPHLGRYDIARLGPAELDAFYAKLLKSGLKPLSVRKSHAVLSAAYSQAVRWGWVERNPVLRATPPPSRGREIRPPTMTELGRLLQECNKAHPDLAALLHVAATTGARRGELCGLRWGDVDLERGTLTISRSISDAGSEVEVKDTKTHQARRLALDATTLDILRLHRERVEERATLAGATLGPDSYVWSQAIDASIAYRPDRVTGAFRTLRDRLDLPHVTFHGLRHFTATTLASQGVPVRTIAGRLGHANPGITLRTYAHYLDVADQEAADAIGLAVGALYPASAKRPSASSSALRGTTTRRPRRTDGSSPRATRS